MSGRRDSRTGDEIRKMLHEENSTQMNCNIETLVGTRLRRASQVSDEDAQIEQDVKDECCDEQEERRTEGLILKTLELLEENDKLKKPDFSLAPLWAATCFVAYLYGVTLGLYMCSK
jgi:hypothetical protein